MHAFLLLPATGYICALAFSFRYVGPFDHEHWSLVDLSSVMLATGKALHDWVSNQLLGKLKGEVIKRTALQTVFSVVALPLTVYKTTGMVVDNEWVQGCVRGLVGYRSEKDEI